MIDPVYPLVFSTAFLGSGHCLGMCGPIIAALSLGRPHRDQGIAFHVLYNSGRITTYVLIGITAGWLGSLLNTARTFTLLSQVLLVVADLLVIAIGLRTTGMFRKLSFIDLELPGALGIMTRTVARLRSLPPAAAAYPIGLVMGFLPCGFLYAIALAAAGRGNPGEGGLIMLAFGLGTLPALLLFGSAFHWVSVTMRNELLRWAGLMVVFVGGYNLYRHVSLTGWL